jgi:hypothetical protein
VDPLSAAQVPSVYFVDGCVIENDYIYVTSRRDDLDPEQYEESRLFFFDRGEWFSHELDWNVRSVCVRVNAPLRQYCALSIQGEVEYQTTDGAVFEKIPGAGIRDGAGAMMEIREIGDSLFACGFGAQVYRRIGSGWISISAEFTDIAGNKGIDITSIDGTSANDLYAVGFFGRIFHFDGRAWAEIDSPTNVNLERVRVHEGRAYICGKAGTLLIGDRDGFAVHSSPGVAEDFWGLAVYREAVYLAGWQQLYRFSDNAITAVDTGLNRPLTWYRLDAKDGVLWSFGPKDLLMYDGTSWVRVPHPDND